MRKHTASTRSSALAAVTIVGLIGLAGLAFVTLTLDGPEAPPIDTPLKALPEMTLPDPGLVPPIVLFGTLSTSTPLLPLPSASVPVTSVPM